MGAGLAAAAGEAVRRLFKAGFVATIRDLRAVGRRKDATIARLRRQAEEHDADRAEGRVIHETNADRYEVLERSADMWRTRAMEAEAKVAARELEDAADSADTPEEYPYTPDGGDVAPAVNVYYPDGVTPVSFSVPVVQCPECKMYYPSKGDRCVWCEAEDAVAPADLVGPTAAEPEAPAVEYVCNACGQEHAHDVEQCITCGSEDVD